MIRLFINYIGCQTNITRDIAFFDVWKKRRTHRRTLGFCQPEFQGPKIVNGKKRPPGR